MRPNSSLLCSLSQAGVKSIQLVGHVKTIIAGKSARTKERNNTNEKTEYQSSNASHAAPKIAMSTNQPSITSARQQPIAHMTPSRQHHHEQHDNAERHQANHSKSDNTEHRQQREARKRQQQRPPHQHLQEQKQQEKHRST